nr:TPA_inf: conotoxin precursor T [Conus judaeus]
MLRFPIFLILLLVLSPAAGFPVESKLENLWARMLSRDFGEEHRTNNRRILPLCCMQQGSPCSSCIPT